MSEVSRNDRARRMALLVVALLGSAPAAWVAIATVELFNSFRSWSH